MPGPTTEKKIPTEQTTEPTIEVGSGAEMVPENVPETPVAEPVPKTIDENASDKAKLDEATETTKASSGITMEPSSSTVKSSSSTSSASSTTMKTMTSKLQILLLPLLFAVVVPLLLSGHETLWF